MIKIEIVSDGPEQTRSIAAGLLDALGAGSILALHGELGSGKTCFVQGLAEALGVEQAVSSPSFTIIKEYSGKLPLYHIDLYRLKNAGEALALGFDDYLEGAGITAVEWAERALEAFPAHAVHVTFKQLEKPDSRLIIIEAPQGSLDSNRLLSLTALASLGNSR